MRAAMNALAGVIFCSLAGAMLLILRDGERGMILDGCWIVGGTAKIREVRSGRIVRLCGGTISDVWGGTISDVGPRAKLDDSAKAHVAIKAVTR